MRNGELLSDLQRPCKHSCLLESFSGNKNFYAPLRRRIASGLVVNKNLQIAQLCLLIAESTINNEQLHYKHTSEKAYCDFYHPL